MRPLFTRPSSLLATSAGWSSELPLSPRECEIARLVASDLTNKEVAAVLEISEWTVSTHLRRMFAKLDVHTKAGMVARVLETVAVMEAQRAHPVPRAEIDEARAHRRAMPPAQVYSVGEDR